jgi:NADH-quinone oxidoreductase subunit N
MTSDDLITLLPLIVIAAASVVLLLVIAFYRNHRISAVITLSGLALAFITLPVVSAKVPRQITPLLILDSYALFYLGLLFAASFVVVLLSYGYLARRPNNLEDDLEDDLEDNPEDNLVDNPEEFYLLLLLVTLGSAVLVASSHFVSFFLGLETLSVALYVLIAYLRSSERSIEAGIKYLILAAVSAAFLLFGMALVYADLGTMEFARMASLGSGNNQAIFLTGLAMIVIGVGFKLAVVPFHMWTPDVYEGAPAPVTAFVATVSKGAMFALLLRYFTEMRVQASGSLFLVFTLIAIASMFVGNLLALLQNNVKRILAYSSIAHLGYLLVAFLAGGSRGATAVTFYLVAYFVTTLSAFGVITVLSGQQRDADTMDDYRGLFWRRPWLASIFTASLLSLAGIPLTAGFIGKVYVLIVGIGSALWLLVIILIVNSAIGLYYYLRIVVAMFRDAPKEISVTVPSLSLAGSAALAVLTLLLVWLGVYPVPLIRVIQTMIESIIE